MTCFAAGAPAEVHWVWTAAGLLAVPAVVALNGFFVAAEFSLVAVRRTRVEELVNQGAGGARAASDAVNTILRWAGYPPAGSEANVHTVDELKLLIDETREFGQIEDEHDRPTPRLRLGRPAPRPTAPEAGT